MPENDPHISLTIVLPGIQLSLESMSAGIYENTGALSKHLCGNLFLILITAIPTSYA